MDRSLLTIAAFVAVILFAGWQKPSAVVLASGAQPRLSVDAGGTVRLVFGRADSVFFASAADGEHFTAPVLNSAGFEDCTWACHAGRSWLLPRIIPWLRQWTSRATYIATSFRMPRVPGRRKGMVNDKPGTAPEGLMALAADEQDHFYAVWLDVRHGKTNNICFAAFDPATGTWSRNKIVYISPDGHVCECCRPSISIKGKQVAIMFRNWLHGSRDLYLITSD